jgi:AmmeMemoRadiSam system protein B
MAVGFLNAAQSDSVHAASDRRWLGGIVPHAGWAFSGAIAGHTIAEMARSQSGRAADVIVVFGAIHTRAPIDVAAFDSHQRWDVPSGMSEVDQEIERKLLESSTTLFRIDQRFHAHEHAVEVEVPLIQVAWPNSAILPVEVPVIQKAEQIGIATAKQLARSGLSAVFLASSDLTHYGPAYEFMPSGVGPVSLAWAKDNDRRLLHRVTDLAVNQIVPEVRDRMNACGGGAITAMLAACREMGATGGKVLRHVNSSEVVADPSRRDMANAVGYAAVVIG